MSNEHAIQLDEHGIRLVCGVQQPWNARTCMNDLGHKGPHEAWLSPPRTYCYWTNDKGPVQYAVVEEPQ